MISAVPAYFSIMKTEEGTNTVVFIRCTYLLDVYNEAKSAIGFIFTKKLVLCRSDLFIVMAQENNLTKGDLELDYSFLTRLFFYAAT